MGKKSPAVLLSEAEAAAQSGKLKTAAKRFEEYQSLVPPDFDLAMKVARIWLQADDAYKAVDAFAAAQELAPNDPQPAIEIARLNNRRFLDHKEAVKVLKEVLKRHPAHAEALEELGYARIEQVGCDPTPERFEKLADVGEKLIAAHPDNAFGYCFRARGLMGVEKPKLDKAASDLNKALALSPGLPQALHFYGLLFIEKGQFDSARQSLAEAAKEYSSRELNEHADDCHRLIDHYKKEAKRAERLTRFRGTATEEQIKVLLECGVQLKKNVSTETVWSELKKHRDTYEEHEPFLSLLLDICGSEYLLNGLIFDTECIEGHGDYVRVFQRLAAITGGALTFKQLEDYIELNDGPDSGGKVWVSFEVAGKKYKWKPKVDDDWFDSNMLIKLSDLLWQVAQLRFCYIPTNSQDMCVLCLPPDKAEQLFTSTLIDGFVIE